MFYGKHKVLTMVGIIAAFVALVALQTVGMNHLDIYTNLPIGTLYLIMFGILMTIYGVGYGCWWIGVQAKRIRQLEKTNAEIYSKMVENK